MSVEQTMLGGGLSRSSIKGSTSGTSILIDNLVSVNSGLYNSLGKMLLHSLGNWNDSLAVNDGLDLIHNVGVDRLLYKSGSLNNTTHARSSGLLDVLLNVVHDILVDLSVNNWLYFQDSVVSHGFLNDRCIDDSSLSNIGLSRVNISCNWSIGSGVVVMASVLDLVD